MFSAQYKTRNIPSLRYGLNTAQTAEELNDAEMADCENFTVEEDTVAMAPGFSLWDDNMTGSPAANQNYGPYWGGIAFVKADGALVEIRQRQDKLEYAADGGVTWVVCTVPITGSPAAPISLAQIPCTFAILNNIVTWTNGTDSVMQSSDGVTWTIPTYGSPAQELPKSRVVFNNGYNRLLFLDQPASPYLLQWTPINDPTSIDTNAFQLIDPNAHGNLKGAGLTPEGSLLLFKQAGLYSVSQFVDDGIVDVNFVGNILFTCHQTVATTENSVMWFTGDGRVQEFIGGAIRQVFGRIDPVGRNESYRSDLACAAYYNYEYRVSIPDVTISTEYNSQEYVIHKNISRPDPIQPYAVTRNRRYYGCYWIENFVFDYGFDTTLFVGDSRSTGTNFGWLNSYKVVTSQDYLITPGLGGETQTGYFISKFFTENVPYHVKGYKKLFSQLQALQNVTFTVSYRNNPYGEWTDVIENVETGELEIAYEDGSSGQFSEGYGFAANAQGEVITDLESSENPRGIQFKITVTTLEDVKFYGFALKFLIKPKFK